MNRTRTLATVLPLLSLLAAQSVGAAGGFPGDRHWAVGIGVATSPSPFADHATEVLPIPLVVYQGDRFHAAGAEIGYTVARGRWGALDLKARPRFEGFDPKAGSALEGMVERDGTLELGASLAFGALNVGFSQDAADVHGGREASLSIGIPWRGKRWDMTTSVGVAWKSADLIDYYYGVRADEATADRAAFQGDSAFTLTSDLTLTSQISWNWMLFVGAQGERLSSAVTDSPIVEDDYQFSSFVGLIRIL
ncbi:MAG: structural protein MipA [Gemmatimonadota bacterium]|nr:MAG: structural protein MipA [Gemmatimonadota bacterium]